MPLNEPKLPEFVATGEQARLIPVVSDGSREGRATSILLATLSAVDEFSRVIFNSIGVRVGSRANIDVYTEIVLGNEKEKEKTRPDGLIIINTGKKQWKALVEAKIGSAELNEEQIKDYLLLAKKYKIDAVITLSNQYSAMPTHHPLQLKKSDLKGVDLFHFSWMFILTEATLLLKSMSVKDQDQRFLLNEMIRYYDHSSVGVSEFTNMNKEWRDVTQKVRSGSILSKNSDEVRNTIISWHQEARDLCLIMSRKLTVPVSLKLTRKHINDPILRIKDDCENLVKTHELICELDIPDAASPLKVSASLDRRSINCSMSLNAPKDKLKPSSKLNWLLKQLKDTKMEDIYISASTLGRGNNPQIKLEEIRNNPDKLLIQEGKPIQPIGFDIILSQDIAGKFSGRATFIQCVEEAVKNYYTQVGEHLEAWTPRAPKVKNTKHDDIHDLDEPEIVKIIQRDDHFEEEKLNNKAAQG